MTVLEFKKMILNSLIVRHGGTKPEWYHIQDCPFCGNSKWKFYLYIKLDDDSPVGYHCFRCNRKGYLLDNETLDALGLNNVDIPKFKGTKNRIRNNRDALDPINLLPDESNVEPVKNYICSRVGVVPTFDELKSFLYVANPVFYVKAISDDDFNPLIFKNRFCFKLTNGNLACRYHNDATDKRWLKFTTSDNYGIGLYVIRTEFHTHEPLNVCICEGIMDAIGLYYHGHIENALFISTQGKDYEAGIKYVVEKGIFGKHISVLIFKDSDVENYQIRYNKKYKKLFKSITIYENVISNDYGHPADEIEIHKSLT